jgi:hypothetical protein
VFLQADSAQILVWHVPNYVRNVYAPVFIGSGRTVGPRRAVDGLGCV